jgi:magnesium chelatase family protein
VATPDAPGLEVLRQASEKLRFTARGYHRMLRLARTLADLEGSDAVRKVHVAEAVGYRRALG